MALMVLLLSSKTKATMFWAMEVAVLSTAAGHFVTQFRSNLTHGWNDFDNSLVNNHVAVLASGRNNFASSRHCGNLRGSREFSSSVDFETSFLINVVIEYSKIGGQWALRIDVNTAEPLEPRSNEHLSTLGNWSWAAPSATTPL